MMGIMIETVLMAFVLGGITGAVIALHLRAEAKQTLARAKAPVAGHHRRRF
jgi:hypothetical protein